MTFSYLAGLLQLIFHMFVFQAVVLSLQKPRKWNIGPFQNPLPRAARLSFHDSHNKKTANC